MAKAHFKRHAQIRAGERYNLRLTRGVQDTICEMIRAGRATLLLKQSHTRSIYAVKHDDAWIPVVYSSKHRCLITCLPETSLLQYASKLPEEARKHLGVAVPEVAVPEVAAVMEAVSVGVQPSYSSAGLRKRSQLVRRQLRDRNKLLAMETANAADSKNEITETVVQMFGAKNEQTRSQPDQATAAEAENRPIAEADATETTREEVARKNWVEAGGTYPPAPPSANEDIAESEVYECVEVGNVGYAATDAAGITLFRFLKLSLFSIITFGNILNLTSIPAQNDLAVIALTVTAAVVGNEIGKMWGRAE